MKAQPLRLLHRISVFCCLILVGLSGQALELGEFELQSISDNGFRGQIPLLDIGAIQYETISAKIAGDRYFSDLDIERSAYLDGLEIYTRRDANGSYIEVIGNQRVDKNFLVVLLEVSWPGSAMLREFAILFDKAGNTPSILSKSELKGILYTQKNETLWRIASKTRPSESVSVNQQMAAIYRLNPDAFIEGNMNLVKTDYKLTIPTEQESLSLNEGSAVLLVKDQSRRYSDILNRESNPVGLPTKAPLFKGDVRILSQEESGPRDGDGTTSWTVRGPKLLKEKELLDQRIKELTQKYSEERLYVNQQLNAKDEEIQALSTQVDDLLKKLGQVRKELTQKVGFLDTFVRSMKIFFQGSAPLPVYLAFGIFAVGLIVWSIRRSSVRREDLDEELLNEDFKVIVDPKIDSIEKQHEPTVSVLDSEEYERELEEESYTTGTKINLAKANIEIDKFEAAQEILKEVIDEGDDEQREQAEDLLKSINAKDSGKE